MTMGAVPQPGPVRRARTATGRVVLVVLGAVIDFCAVVNVPGAAVLASETGDSRIRVTGLGVALVFLAILSWLSLLWGDRMPLLPVVAGAVLAGIGVSYLLLLVGSVRYLRVRPERLRVVGISVTVGVVAFVARELFTPWGAALPWFLSSDPDAEGDIGWIVATIVFAVVSLAAAVAVVAFSRTRDRADRSERRAAVEVQRADALREETVRQAERERIARDMHDALAHRLSVVSLHAGALESAASGAAAEEMARTVREQTHAALQDMRGLIGDLRKAPDAGGGASATMRALGTLISGVRAAGHPINSLVMIEGVERAGALLDGAVYRIVQEAITNAVKHAPGAPVDVFVQVSPSDGARVRVVNPLGIPRLPTVPGGRNGLLGIRERAAALDGQAWIGPFEGSFIVDVTLPWQERG